MGQIIGSGLFVLLGAVITIIGTYWGTYFQTRPRLYVSLQPTPDSELTEKEFRTKTSASEYTIEVCNIGREPCLLDRMEITYKRDCLLDALFFSDQDRLLKPYESVNYVLDEQEIERLKHNLRNYTIKKPSKVKGIMIGVLWKIRFLRPVLPTPHTFSFQADAIICDVGNKKYTAKIQLFLIVMGLSAEHNTQLEHFVQK